MSAHNFGSPIWGTLKVPSKEEISGKQILSSLDEKPNIMIYRENGTYYVFNPSKLIMKVSYSQKDFSEVFENVKKVDKASIVVYSLFAPAGMERGAENIEDLREQVADLEKRFSIEEGAVLIKASSEDNGTLTSYVVSENFIRPEKGKCIKCDTVKEADASGNIKQSASVVVKYPAGGRNVL